MSTYPFILQIVHLLTEKLTSLIGLMVMPYLCHQLVKEWVCDPILTHEGDRQVCGRSQEGFSFLVKENFENLLMSHF